MIGIESISRPLAWPALLLAALLAGCGSGGGDGAAPGPGPGAGACVPTGPGAGNGTGGDGRGPAPIPLLTAGNFAILAETAITNIPTSAVIGNVGLAPALGVNIELTCAQVTGVIYTFDSAGSPSCRQRNSAALLTQAVADGHAAWHEGRLRPPDCTDAGTGNIGGLVLPPAAYKWNTDVRIQTDLTLTGGPNDVWIFVIEHDLIVSPGVQIFLEGGALPQNVFWLTLALDADVELGADSRFQGVILSETSIAMKTGASIRGRLMAATSINLEQNTVTQP